MQNVIISHFSHRLEEISLVHHKWTDHDIGLFRLPSDVFSGSLLPVFARTW